MTGKESGHCDSAYSLRALLKPLCIVCAALFQPGMQLFSSPFLIGQPARCVRQGHSCPVFQPALMGFHPPDPHICRGLSALLQCQRPGCVGHARLRGHAARRTHCGRGLQAKGLAVRSSFKRNSFSDTCAHACPREPASIPASGLRSGWPQFVELLIHSGTPGSSSPP